jgi:tRNA-specific 2-thiouridylase
MPRIQKEPSKTVVVAMSGGVDSSTAAVLLNEQGYRVIGITMKLWQYDQDGSNPDQLSGCCASDSCNDARLVCSALGISHYVFNFSEQFQQQVVQYFVQEYLSGRTPNPCVRCNARIKWKTLFDKAQELGADYLATGHYARVFFNQPTNRHELHRAVDLKKDQSYALWGLQQSDLAHTIFPLGNLTKTQVRLLAKKNHLPTAERRESQEICFIPDNNYHRLITDRQKEIGAGEIVSTDGQIIGSHQGYPFYTVGQRRGLGGGFKEPMYVVDIDAAQNRITIGSEQALYARELMVEQVNWVSRAGITEPMAAMIKIRYNDTLHAGTLFPSLDQEIRIRMADPVRSITPGQSAVFYDGDVLLGGGIIKTKIS